MNRLSLLVIMLVFLVVGGALTSLSSDGDSSRVLPVIQQSADPAASTSEVEPWQAEQLFLVILVIFLGVGGLGAGIAAIIWFLNREILTAKASPNRVDATTAAETS